MFYFSTDGNWYVLKSSDGGLIAYQFGTTGDKPVQGDYDGDGKDDFAVYRNGNWYISLNASGQFRATNFGLNTYIPAPTGYIPLQ